MTKTDIKKKNLKLETEDSNQSLPSLFCVAPKGLSIPLN